MTQVIFGFPSSTNSSRLAADLGLCQERPMAAGQYGHPGLSLVGCRSKPIVSHFGVGAPPILVYVSGDGDVHWGYGLLTHGQLHVLCERHVCVYVLLVGAKKASTRKPQGASIHPVPSHPFAGRASRNGRLRLYLRIGVRSPSHVRGWDASPTHFHL